MNERILCADPGGKSVPTAVEAIADAVTHARFVGTDQASDGIVLMKILQVLILKKFMLIINSIY